jgi:hypothetical protein
MIKKVVVNIYYFCFGYLCRIKNQITYNILWEVKK